jgi:hypothetical protein
VSGKYLKEINDCQTQINEPGPQLNGTSQINRKRRLKHERATEKAVIKDEFIFIKWQSEQTGRGDGRLRYRWKEKTRLVNWNQWTKKQSKNGQKART